MLIMLISIYDEDEDEDVGVQLITCVAKYVFSWEKNLKIFD